MSSRTKNASRNIAYGFLNKTVTLLLPFVTRTLVLYLLGATYLGIGTLYSSVLSFLSLAELGLGASIVYAMYKPIVERDYATVGALLKYFRKLYRIIGAVILAVGVMVMPLLPLLTKGEAPAGIDIYWLYLFYLVNSSISYFCAGYRQSLLTANQRVDIRDKIAICVNVSVRALEVAVLCLTRNYYAYAFVPICGTIVTNIVTSVQTKRLYPEIDCSGEIADEQKRAIKKKLGGLFGTKLNSIVIHQADTLVISSFLGLTVLAQYGNYYYVLNAVSGFIMIFFSSLTAGIGNKIASDTREAVYTLFRKINFVNAWVVGWCSICLVCLYQPLMAIWVGKALSLPFSTAVWMALYLYVYQIQRAILTFKDAGGLWYEDRYRPYVSMVFNLASNILLVRQIGVNGVVISTILAFLISVPWCNAIVFRKMFHMSGAANIIEMLRGLCATVVIGIATYALCALFHGIWGFVAKLVLCLVVPNALYALLYHKTEEFRALMALGRKLLKRRHAA